MPLQKCSLVRLGPRVGVLATARVARSEGDTGYWVPHEPFVVVDADDHAALAAAVRAALAASIDDPPLPRAPAVRDAYGRFVQALGAADPRALMATATLGDMLDDGTALRCLVMRRVPGGFQVDPAAHFDVARDADDATLAAAVHRLLGA